MKTKLFALIGTTCLFFNMSCAVENALPTPSGDRDEALSLAHVAMQTQQNAYSTMDSRRGSAQRAVVSAAHNWEDTMVCPDASNPDGLGSLSMTIDYTDDGGRYAFNLDHCRVDGYYGVDASRICRVEPRLHGSFSCSFNNFQAGSVEQCATATLCSGLEYQIGDKAYQVGFQVITDRGEVQQAQVCVNGHLFSLEDLQPSDLSTVVVDEEFCSEGVLPPGGYDL